VNTSLPVVLVGRVLQGGYNVTFGLAFLILRERLSGPAFGFCCGVIASINGGVGGVDALVGGFMVDHFGYRSIFVLILVVGLAAIGLATKAVPADDPGRAASGRMDWVGAALIALAVAGIDLFLAQGGHSGWSSPIALGFIAAAIVALVAFDRDVVILLIPVLGFAFGGVAGTALSVLGVLQAREDEPGSLPGLSNAAFGVGSSLGFAWAGPIVGQGTVAGFHSALWISVGIGVVALGMSLVLKPRLSH
jgi:predicted MFS family arabinose efflux permease